jgi:hypothetical protein
MPERKDYPISDEKLEELNQALIGFVQEGTIPPRDILKTFLNSDRLNVVRGLGKAGLNVRTTDMSAVTRYQRLSRLAYDQINTSPFDGQDFESGAFISSAAAPNEAPDAPEINANVEIPDGLLEASDADFLHFINTGTLPKE